VATNIEGIQEDLLRKSFERNAGMKQDTSKRKIIRNVM